MNKRELAILEKAYEAEVRAALEGGTHIIQTKCKEAKALEEKGLLARTTEKLHIRHPVTIEGYELTHAGRAIYCATCEGEEAVDG